MSSYTLDQRAVHDKTLVAATADKVTVSTAGQQDEWVGLEILSDGAAAVYVSTDGTTAVVSGSHCYKLPASTAPNSVRVDVETDHTGNASVSLISSGTPTYSVTRV